MSTFGSNEPPPVENPTVPQDEKALTDTIVSKGSENETRRGPEHSLSMFIDTIGAERIHERELVSWRALLSDFVASSLALENLLAAIPAKYEASALAPGWVPMDLPTSSSIPTSLTLIPETTLAEQHKALFAMYAFNDNESRQQMLQQGYITENGKVADSIEVLEATMAANPLIQELINQPKKPEITLNKQNYIRTRTSFLKLNNFIDTELMSILNDSINNPEADLTAEDLPEPYFRGRDSTYFSLSETQDHLRYTNLWKDASDKVALGKRLEDMTQLVNDLKMVYGTGPRFSCKTREAT